LSVRPILALFAALSVAALNIPALGAHYGTEPPPPPINSAMLRITDQPSLCASSKRDCIETTGATRAYPVADGDRITLFWSSDPNEVDGVIHLGKLFLPLNTRSSTSIAPVTLEVDMPTGTAATVTVEYAGTRHHAPLTTGVWQPITLYNPDERTLYVLFQPAPQPPQN
jgi:hypothetical protein